MTYNEPIIYIEYLIDLANECHENDLKFILKTNAYINKEPWKEICSVVDAINIDFKGSSKDYQVHCKSKFIILNRIKEAYEHKNLHIEISVPIYQGYFYYYSLRLLSNLLTELDKNIPVHLLKIYPAFRFKSAEVVSDEEIEKAKNILSKSLNNIYIF